MHNLFLDNGSNGKNNWWRYLLTIIISWGGGILATGVLVAVLMLAFIYMVPNTFYQFDLNSLVSNGLFLIIIE